ncbi:MAG: hypothetical protein K0S07_906 [Chlamydiales bacterium]|jgi:hypothetical protein|nr:hypothetical protein [Chlamydiales bacterium]
MGKNLLRYGQLALLICCLWMLGSLSIHTVDWFYGQELAVSPAKEGALPKGAFRQRAEDYDAIPLWLTLEHERPKMRLPDLSQHLMFLGTNQRPDENVSEPILYFNLKGQLKATSVAAGKPLYLTFDKKSAASRYLFSPNNEPTSLWIEARPSEEGAFIQVRMLDEKGDVIEDPEKNRQFTLLLKEYGRLGTGVKWEIGEWKVDPSLLIRQKAVWCGQDLFLRDLGGDEYAFTQDKERIDFNGLYTCFVGLRGVMVFDEGQWKVVEPGPDSVGKPLLQVKSIEERLMRFDLWDADGKSHMALNLPRGREEWPDRSLLNFRYVGAKTKNQAILEVNGERLHVRRGDWWILEGRKWQKLSSKEQILNYVFGKTHSPLFVFLEMARRGEKQVLEGILYDATRSVAKKVELGLEPNALFKAEPSPDDERLPPKERRTKEAP